MPSASSSITVGQGGPRTGSSLQSRLPGSTAPRSGEPGRRGSGCGCSAGWASLGMRMKEGRARGCSRHPMRPSWVIGPAPRAQQHPPAVTQGRRRKPGRHGRPGAWEACAHASPRQPAHGGEARQERPLANGGTRQFGGARPQPHAARPDTHGTGPAKASGARTVQAALRRWGAVRFGGCAGCGGRALQIGLSSGRTA